MKDEKSKQVVLTVTIQTGKECLYNEDANTGMKTGHHPITMSLDGDLSAVSEDLLQGAMRATEEYLRTHAEVRQGKNDLRQMKLKRHHTKVVIKLKESILKDLESGIVREPDFADDLPF